MDIVNVGSVCNKRYQTGCVIYLQRVHLRRVLVMISVSLQCMSFRPILFVSVN